MSLKRLKLKVIVNAWILTSGCVWVAARLLQIRVSSWLLNLFDDLLSFLVAGVGADEDLLELLEVDLAAAVYIVQADHLVDLQRRYLHLSLPIERFAQVLLRDVVRVVHVELFEQAPKLLICECLLNGKDGRDEFRVVNATIADEVDLFDDRLYGGVVKGELQLFERCSQLCGADHPSPVSVNRLELLSKLLCSCAHLRRLVRLNLVTFDLGLAHEQI